MQACRMALEGSKSGIRGLWGNQDEPEENVHTLHKYVWSVVELAEVLRDTGFSVVRTELALTHDPDRDFRLVALK